jgi:flagellar L-ring protein precursor FlgH
MSHGWIVLRRVVGLAGLVLVLAGAAEVRAQSGSLYGSPERRRPLTLAGDDWTYIPTPQPRQLKLNDLITVLVDEKTQVISEGEIDRKKKAYLKAALKDWIVFDSKSLGIVPDPQGYGDPKIDGQWDNKYKAEADLESRDAMKFNIAARIVDIRPNGNLVIEARHNIRNNEESWEVSLTGVVRPKDILPNNTVQSEKIADLQIHKRESGHVRDSYRRGWLLRWLDRYQPF